MRLRIEELMESVELLGKAGGPEVAIVAQFLIDLSVSARFSDASKPMSNAAVRRLLKLRIARDRASHRMSGTIH